MADAPSLEYGGRPEGAAYQEVWTPAAVHDILEGIEEGRRQDSLFRYACRLRAKKMHANEALFILGCLAERCDPPFSWEETVEIVEDVWRRYGRGG